MRLAASVAPMTGEVTMTSAMPEADSSVRTVTRLEDSFASSVSAAGYWNVIPCRAYVKVVGGEEVAASGSGARATRVTRPTRQARPMTRARVRLADRAMPLPHAR